MRIKGLMLILLLAPALAPAQDCDCEEAPAQDPGLWSGNIGFGYLATAGNTETSSANLNFKAVRDGQVWVNNLYALAFAASDDKVSTAERYNAGYRLDRKLSQRSFVFGWLDFSKDLFSGFDQKYSLALGYGRKLVDSEKHKLNGEIGAGWRREDLGDGTKNENAILKLAGNYAWAISNASQFTQTLVVESGSDNTFAEAVSRVRAQLVGRLGLSLSLSFKHNTEPPAGNDKTDTYTAVNLDYAF